MQRDEKLVYINNGVNRQQIDAIHMGYCQTWAVHTRRSGLLVVSPDQTPIRPRTRIGSNSSELLSKQVKCNCSILCNFKEIVANCSSALTSSNYYVLGVIMEQAA